MKKLLAIGIILLFVGMGIPSTGKVMEQSSTMSPGGITLYVGGDGPGNYSKIQYAINDASDGDTVFVYNGTYVENVVVHTSINLIGEDREKTIIERNWIDDVVHIFADRVTISSFNIHCSDVDVACINISSNSIIVKENIIWSGGGDGIKISGANNITISNNTIFKHYFQGIRIRKSNDIRILNNNIYTRTLNCGIHTYQVEDLLIFENNFYTSVILGWDIDLSSTNCLIKRNTFYSSGGGIYLLDCKKCVVTENNFMEEKYRILLVYIFPNSLILNKHKVTNNYWYKPRDNPKLIIGEYVPSVLLWFFLHLYIPIPHFDWHPAKEPYDIEV